MNFNLVILDYDEAGLIKSKERLATLYPNVEIDTISCDMTKLDTVEAVAEVLDKVFKRDVSILINNAGISDKVVFHFNTDQDIHDIMKVNAQVPAMFCNMFYGRLLERQKKSAIINVASVAGMTPQKITHIYSMTKSFLVYFSNALHEESKGRIDIMTICPGYITTALTRFRTAPDTLSPAQAVEGILRDFSNRYSETSCSWIHALPFWGVIEPIWYINNDLFTKVMMKVYDKDSYEEYHRIGVKKELGKQD